MTTFITGGAGFIGSNFAHYVSDIWKDVVILDKLTYAGDMDNLYPLKYPVKGVDLAYENRLEELFKQYKPKTIFNFAAETHVDNSIDDVAPFIDTNIIGTINLLKLSVKYDVQMFHHISTDEVYGALKLNEPPFTENSPYNPQNPYAASKAASDHFVMSYHNTYGLPVMITNCSNNYGPRQHREKLIPKTINNILEGKKIPIYSQGENIRDWIYVEDHCAGILGISYAGDVGQKYNIGGECEMTNLELVKMIIKMMNASEDLIEFVDDRPGHDLRYAIDNAKIYKTISFQPEINIEDGLKKTIDWYEKNRD
jgi:dTDP-glucose 4,6-dehydratase